jgi:hypothetical protein
VATNLCGAANLRLPTGGFTYGMPRYSTTHVVLGAMCPVMGPLDELTVKYFASAGLQELEIVAAEAKLVQRVRTPNITVESIVKTAAALQVDRGRKERFRVNPTQPSSATLSVETEEHEVILLRLE